MKLPTLVVSVLVLAALSVAVFFARRPAPPPSADPRLNQPLVARDALEKAVTLRLADAGKTVELARQADGSWKVPSYHDFPADFTKLSGFVGNLTEAKLQRLVTSSPDRIARLEFKDTKIELLDAAGKTLFAVTLGKNADAGGRYVRFGDEPKAFLANLNAWLDADAKNWANAELLNLKADDIAKIEIPFPEGGSVTVSRAKKEDPWTAENAPGNQKIKADKIGQILNAVGNLRFTETTALDDANAKSAFAHQRLFKLETFDKKIVQVGLGRKPEEKKLKAPAPAADGKSGPAALGNLADLAKKEESKSGEAKPDDKPLAPEFETLPAGPVFASVSHGDAAAPVNALMAKRAFQIADYAFTSLPQKAEELFEPAPPPAPPAPAAPAAPEEKKPETKK
ncbi:MAG: hypothetical protein B9S34_00510 [Opitutia bacterium Tous-C1TDCM]|nr:MAG: hypothetical protein B9S34_00510 [Opitutae bacterium Tous-C1TDCM]